MQTMRIYNRFGIAEFIEWDYNPDKNPVAKEKAYKKLNAMGIIAYVYEVAPEVFWYSITGERMILPDGMKFDDRFYKDIDCSVY